MSAQLNIPQAHYRDKPMMLVNLAVHQCHDRQSIHREKILLCNAILGLQTINNTIVYEYVLLMFNLSTKASLNYN